MTRKEFFAQVGLGAAVLLLPTCVTGCKKSNTSSSTNSGTVLGAIDFTLDVSTGALSKNGGYLVHSGVIVARTNSGSFIAVASACTHNGTSVQYSASTNDFVCPNHGARFTSTGSVTQGPASTNLQQFKTTLTGSSLRVFS